MYAYTTNPNSFTDPSGLCPPPGCGGTSTPGGVSSPSTTCDPGQRNCYNPGDCNATIDGGSLCFNPVGNAFDWMNVPIVSTHWGWIRNTPSSGVSDPATDNSNASNLQTLAYWGEITTQVGTGIDISPGIDWTWVKTFFKEAVDPLPEFRQGGCGRVFGSATTDALNPFSPSLSSGGEATAAFLAASKYNAVVRYAASQPNYLGGTGLIYPMKSSVVRSMLTEANAAAASGALISVDLALAQGVG